MLERNYLTRSCNIYIEQRDESRASNANRHTEKKIARVVDARWKAETRERERESGDTIRLIVRKSELGGVFDRNQFARVQRRATLAMSYCEGWNRDPGKMAGEWSRDYRGFSALIPRFFYTPGGRSIPPLADFWIRHAIPAAWNLYLISSLFFPPPFFSVLRSSLY